MSTWDRGELEAMPSGFDELAFRVETRSPAPGVVVVAPFGEADAATANALEQALGSAADGGAGLVAVDLAGTRFVDSTTLGVLLRARRRLREQDVELRLARLDPRVQRVFALTQLDRLFTIHSSLDDAVAPAQG
jgi:anti-sigma B factor antagonist